jgi:hypothetical protein
MSKTVTERIYIRNKETLGRYHAADGRRRDAPHLSVGLTMRLPKKKRRITQAATLLDLFDVRAGCVWRLGAERIIVENSKRNSSDEQASSRVLTKKPHQWFFDRS